MNRDGTAFGGDRASTASGEQLGDNELVDLVRAGDVDAYSLLFHRYYGLAVRVAAMGLDLPGEAEDVAAEAFVLVLGVLAKGGGPHSFFRAYLMSVVTNLSHAQNRRTGRVLLFDDESRVERSTDVTDPAVHRFENQTVMRAFGRLSERYRTVLWLTYVERMKPRHLAEFLGIKANAVSALRIRALERLREEYLSVHLRVGGEPGCLPLLAKYGPYVRGRSAGSERTLIDEHLVGCVSCPPLIRFLTEIAAFIPKTGRQPGGDPQGTLGSVTS